MPGSWLSSGGSGLGYEPKHFGISAVDSVTSPDLADWLQDRQVMIDLIKLLNRAPTTKSVPEKTPYELWHGSKPPVHFFRIFGYVAHVKNIGGHLRKLNDRSTPMVFIGYEPGSKAYRFYNPGTDRVVI